MAFATGYLPDQNPVGPGEIQGNAHVILTADNFEDNLVLGRFAKLDSGRLDNMDASASPVIAGVTLRRAGNAVEDGDLLDADLFDYAEYVRFGLVTVQAVTGESPTMFQTIYAHNTAGDDVGKATVVTTNNVQTSGEFIAEVDTDVWLIYFNGAA